MATATMLRIGVDPGFGGIKMAAIESAGQQKSVHVPSVVGIGDTDLGLLSLNGASRRKRELPITVAWDGVSYLVGDHVGDYARVVERMDFNRLRDGFELRALLYAALGKLLEGGDHRAALMVGLPVEVMANKELAKETRTALRGWLVGAHVFRVDGIETRLQVEQLQVLAQPAGAYFAWGFDNHGRPTRSAEDLQDPAAICDIGFNTLDLFAVEDGQVKAKFTGGDVVGMRRAADTLARMVKKQYGVALSLHEADALLRQTKPLLATADGRKDLSEAADAALNSTTGEILAFLSNRWGNGRQFRRLIFTGGGAEAIHAALVREYPHGVILENPVQANALGLARAAMGLFK